MVARTMFHAGGPRGVCFFELLAESPEAGDLLTRFWLAADEEGGGAETVDADGERLVFLVGYEAE